jgi:dihydroxy-acid dehydratase
MALPKKIIGKGVTDMVRHLDGRMSGHALALLCCCFTGSCNGGTLALVQNGDIISLDAPTGLCS